MNEERIAVVGGGIAGLASAWLLSRRFHVTLFERNDYVGGHINTLECPLPEGPLPVDTGFIVYNEPNYPQLTALFRYLHVPTRPSDMSFAFSSASPDLEYAGDDLNTLFAQRRNLLRPAFWGMARDILRFNRESARRLERGLSERLGLGDLLDELRFGESFRRYYLLPMSAAIWSCPGEQMLAFPAQRFLRFFHNHGLIRLRSRPRWRTVAGGARECVRRMLPGIGRVVTGAPVTGVRRLPDGIELTGPDGALGRFDQAVIAAHADQTLAMLDGPTEHERTVLGAFRYQENEAVLHTDPALMPRRRAVWSSWNHLTDDHGDNRRRPAVTYWMNRLQRLPTGTDVFVTLNPLTPPDPERVVRRMRYEHPVFDHDALHAQRLLPALQGRDRLWFCGSYFNYGFHEDALQSAVDVAAALGVDTPWPTAVSRRPTAPRPTAAEAGALS